jgi:hypothetical protein
MVVPVTSYGGTGNILIATRMKSPSLQADLIKVNFILGCGLHLASIYISPVANGDMVLFTSIILPQGGARGIQGSDQPSLIIVP